jgi:cyclopropane fatty-acyl-phospholipid synthase-like methyltransferase
MLKLDPQRIRAVEGQIIATRNEKAEGLPNNYLTYWPDYVGFHSRRFAMLVAMLEGLGVDEKSHLLDIGPTYTTKLFADSFHCRVDSLSFSPDEKTPFGENYYFDLNLSQEKKDWRSGIGPYDVIVMAEVIEHLHTAPKVVLSYLIELLKPGGYLILQTPNALGIKQRIQLLLGKHPYEQISEEPTSPNHFRESTLAELVAFSQAAGFEVVHAKHYNYFNPTFRQKKDWVKPWMGALFFRISDLLPARLKRGMTVVCRKPG